MADVKEVKVQLDPVAEKAMLGKSRRRRTRKATDGGAGEPEPVSALSPPSASELAPAAAAPIVVAKADYTPPALPTAPPAAASPPVASLSSTAVVGGAAEPIAPAPIIKARETAPATAGAVMPRIIPHKKRISSAPAAQTLKKPRLVVPMGGAENAPSAPPAIPGESAVASADGAGAHDGTSAVIGGKHLKKTRKFRERQIKITVKTGSTRKFRRTVKARVRAMPAAAVRKFLLRKGVIKPKENGSAPPEDMMRGMLIDYLMLHNAE